MPFNICYSVNKIAVALGQQILGRSGRAKPLQQVDFDVDLREDVTHCGKDLRAVFVIATEESEWFQTIQVIQEVEEQVPCSGGANPVSTSQFWNHCVRS